MKDTSKVELFDEGNWLEKERARERKVSAWDFDDDKKLRYEHALDCDVDKVAREHMSVHESNIPTTINKKVLSPSNSSIKWILIDVLALFGYVFLFFIEDSLLQSGFSMVNSVLIFFGLTIGFVLFGLFKRIPSTDYLRSLFFITLIFEIVYIITVLMDYGLF